MTVNTMTQALEAASDAQAELVQGDMFETLFPIGSKESGPVPMARLPQYCSACHQRVEKLTGGFEIDPLPVGRTWKIIHLYDKPECLPEGNPQRAAWEAREGDGGWYSWNTRTGADARDLGHPWDMRDTDLWEEAVLALHPSARENERVITAIRAAFDQPETYYYPKVGRDIFDTTIIPLQDGSRTTLGAIIAQHTDELCVPLYTITAAGKDSISRTYRPVDLCEWIINASAQHAA